MRKLYQIDAERQGGQLHPVKTWLVLARSEDEARMFIPRSYTVARVADCGENASGESRIVGWMGEAYEVA